MKTDYHIHSVFSDGNDTLEEIALFAIDNNYDVIGFTDHSYTDFDTSYCIKKEKIEEYTQSIRNLKEKYADKIEILCGIEQDYYSDMPTDTYDYVIGSVHYVKKNGKYIPVDETAEFSKQIIDELYGGSFDDFAADYFANVSDILNKTNADIIGHFDLVSKFIETADYCESEKYLQCALAAIKNLCCKGKLFEINTGAIAKSIKSVPYPSEKILKMINDNGGKIIFCSDCHKKEKLGYDFENAKKIAQKCGFKTYCVLSKKAYIEYKL